MSQLRRIDIQERKKELTAAATGFEGNKEWKRYLNLCKLDDVRPKNLLKDISYYENVEKIETEHIEDQLEEALVELYENAKKEDPKKRAARRGTLEKLQRNQKKKQCNQCKSYNIIYVNAHSRDAGTIAFPSGIQHTGYFPSIPQLCGGDDVEMDFCADCGFLVGFDKEKFAAALLRAEYLGDLYY